LAAVGIVSGKQVIAPLLSDKDWKSVVALSRRREVLMADTGLPAQAKTVRWSGGKTRFFSHFPGEAPEGYAGEESAEHAALKIAVYERLMALGIPAMLESGRDDWRADVLVGESTFGPSLAIEVQLSRQSAERTYERTLQRSQSGTQTLWIFGPTSSSGHLGQDLLINTPVFSTSTPHGAADIAEAVCTGVAYYDTLEGISATPARPIAALVPCKCGTKWLCPIGVVLLPNRLRGDLKPFYVSCTATSAMKPGNSRQMTEREASTYLRRYDKVALTAGKEFKLPVGVGFEIKKSHWGGKVGSVYVRSFQCPDCYSSVYGRGLASIKLPFQGRELLLCPVPIACEVDARPVLSIDPRWLAGPIDPKGENLMSPKEWRRRFIEPIAAGFLLVPKDKT
jgi:hypothetical protein